MSQAMDGISQLEESSWSMALPTSETALQKRKIAMLEEKLLVLESGQAIKQKYKRYCTTYICFSPLTMTVRETNYYVSKGRALRRVIALFDSIEDLIAENDRRCNGDESDEDVTIDQHRLQAGYIILNNMLKKLGQGADGAQGDDTSKLKCLVAEWVNREFKLNPPLDPDDKNCHGFVNDACGRLLCPTELDWNSTIAGIRDHADGFVVTEMSWPAFMYEKYTADQNNLEEGLFKSSLLVRAFKAIFTSPSSAKEVADEGNGADIIANNRRARKDFSSVKKVKTHVAQIIKMHQVTPRSTAYVSCQLCFALSSVTSWRSVDGNFDYIPFWQSIVDFFEQAPGRVAQKKSKQLLTWWTRKIFGTSCRAELSEGAKANMSVNALARQRAQVDDASFDSA
ncbi:hypothetical protein EDD22DRAFT_956352 [Suillus occidentalis]|nr:hypothetical protein EDD22DRAFT_956352 [Suillus occidentalis]